MRLDPSLAPFLLSHFLFTSLYLGTLTVPEASLPSLVKVTLVGAIVFGRITYLVRRWRDEIQMA